MTSSKPQHSTSDMMNDDFLTVSSFAGVYTRHHDTGAAQLPEGVHLSEHSDRGSPAADLLTHLFPPPLHLYPCHRCRVHSQIK